MCTALKIDTGGWEVGSASSKGGIGGGCDSTNPELVARGEARLVLLDKPRLLARLIAGLDDVAMLTVVTVALLSETKLGMAELEMLGASSGMDGGATDVLSMFKPMIALRPGWGCCELELGCKLTDIGTGEGADTAGAEATDVTRSWTSVDIQVGNSEQIDLVGMWLVDDRYVVGMWSVTESGV